MLAAKFFDLVAFYRIHETRRNMWSDNLMMDLVYIICEWD